MSDSNMPKDEGLDHSLKLLKEGYDFIINRREEMDSNVFKTRILAQDAYCLSGSEAARLFYDESKFSRKGAAPLPIKKTLFGKHGVQGLDDEEHRHRKAMYMALWTQDAVEEIRTLTRKYWELAIDDWERRDEIILYDEAKKLITRAICEWAGVPLKDDEIAERADQLSEMYEQAGHASIAHFKGWIARSKAEGWVEEMVKAVRNGDMAADESRALYQFTWHKDLEGKLLDEKVVAEEILNILRPTVANSVWVTFQALALHDFPQQKAALKSGKREPLTWFSQEVRRFYPFFPFTVARVRKDFSWKEFKFEKGTLTLLDLYGTNHHPDEWDRPNDFAPSRFQNSKVTPFNFIPQGGGEYDKGHRCAGEWITVVMMEESADFLVNKISYDLPEQDLTYSLSEIPSRPKSRIRMTNIKRKAS